MAKDFLTDEEMAAAQPQDAEGMASQGWSQLFAPVAQSLAQQYQEGGQQIHQALQGDPSTDPVAMAALQNLGIQGAAGSLGEGKVGEGIKLVDTAPHDTYTGKVRWDRGPSAPAKYGKTSSVALPQAEIGSVEVVALPQADIGKAVKAQESAVGPSLGSTEVQEIPQQALGTTSNDIKQAGNQDLGTVSNDIKQSDPYQPDPGKVTREYADGGEVADFIPDDQMSQYEQSGPTTPQLGQQMSHSAPADFIPDDQFKSDEDALQEKYGTPTEQFKAGLEGAAQGVAGPLAPAAERALGVSPEAMRGREEANPWTHGLAEAGAFGASMLTGTGEAALLSHAGEAAAKLLPIATSPAAKVGELAFKSAAEMGLLQTGDEVSKMIKEDPNQSVQTAMVNVGLASVLGGAAGGAIGSVSKLWDATAGAKASQLAEDFKGGLDFRLNNPDLVESATQEASEHYNHIRDLAKGVYGDEGVKAEAIAKALPQELTDPIVKQSQSVATDLKDQITKMVKNDYDYPSRLTEKLKADLDNYAAKVSVEDLNPEKVFNATQDLKNQLQSYAGDIKRLARTDDAYQFVHDANELSKKLKEGLQDSKVWGEAADVQKSINSAFHDYLGPKKSSGPLPDFERMFTTETNGVRSVDPGKMATYINKLDKPTAARAKTVLENYLKASDKYARAIGDTHMRLGVESPYQPSSLSVLNHTLEKQTAGARLAHMLVDKGLAGVGGKGIGAGVGAAVGHASGSPMLGAILGERILGPFAEKMLPAIAKPLLTMAANGRSIKAAADYGASIVKGELMIDKATKGLFAGDKDIIPASSMPTEKERSKITKALDENLKDPNTLINRINDSHLGHYMPEHQQALAESTGNVVSFLNAMKPSLGKANPLDSKPIASQVQIARYNNALNLAQQPLMVLNKIAKGNVTPEDISALKTMYPGLYNKLAYKLTAQMVDHLSKGKTVPYQTRMGLSLFAGQALDSTMTPMSIQASQSIGQGSMGGDQQQPQQNQGPKRSMSSLNKMPSTYMTPAQSREAERAKHR